MKREYILAIALVGVAAFWLYRNRMPEELGLWGGYSEQESFIDSVAESVDNVLYPVFGVTLMDWQKVAERRENAGYVAAAHAAERKYNMPENLIVRLIYQESRFRQDIISGAVKSSAGAVGIMQIVPKWHPDVNAYDAYGSIDYGAGYLAKLYQQFGSWQLALAAYNWGPGNLGKHGIQNAPLETRNYFSQILSDIGVA